MNKELEQAAWKAADRRVEDQEQMIITLVREADLAYETVSQWTHSDYYHGFLAGHAYALAETKGPIDEKPIEGKRHYFCHVLNNITGVVSREVVYRTGIETWDLDKPFEVIRHFDESDTASQEPEGYITKDGRTRFSQSAGLAALNNGIEVIPISQYQPEASEGDVVEFAEWMNDYVQFDIITIGGKDIFMWVSASQCHGDDPKHFTTAELYQLFKQSNQ